MKKSFVERLTDEQIDHFLDASYGNTKKHDYNYKRYGDSISATLDDGSGAYDSTFYLTLNEYDTSGNDRADEDWVNYLYSIFGESYRRAYTKHIMKRYSKLNPIKNVK